MSIEEQARRLYDYSQECEWDDYVKAVGSLIQQVEVEAEGRGRTAVLSAVKEWADDTEVTYNKMVETELDKIASLTTPKQPKTDGED